MGKPAGLIVKLNRLVNFFTGLVSWLPPLAARVSLGLMFIGTGWGKLHHIDKVTAFFTQLGLPAPSFQAHLVGGAELVCGSLLLAGFLTRIAALPLAIIMGVALFTAKRGDIGGFDDLVGLVEYGYLLLLVWLAVAGAGALSLDRIISPFFVKKPVASAKKAA